MNKLGEGGFCSVWEGMHVKTGEIVAIKILSKKSNFYS